MKEALASAGALESKAASAFDAESSDLATSVDTFMRAIAALENGVAGSSLLQSGVRSDIRKVDKNSNRVSDEDGSTLSFLSGGDHQRYAPQSSEIIGHFDDWQRLAQEMAQAHHDARDAMKAVWK